MPLLQSLPQIQMFISLKARARARLTNNHYVDGKVQTRTEGQLLKRGYRISGGNTQRELVNKKEELLLVESILELEEREELEALRKANKERRESPLKALPYGIHHLPHCLDSTTLYAHQPPPTFCPLSPSGG